MPTTAMLLSVACVVFLAPSPALCQMSGQGGMAGRATASSSLRARIPVASRPLQVEASSAGRFTISDLKKLELKAQVNKLLSICPSCSTVVTIGGTTIIGANGAGVPRGSSSTQDTALPHAFRTQELKCAALPAGVTDDDYVLVSKALYRYLYLRAQYGAQ
ncbi:hypothetical protein BZG29_14685 [Janthinobacterium sp. LM6]|uniref:hypothetical protein n=1 Tax=Janthinobacterium sp. LM6 TaxID=1938606 RepID=UPI000983FC4F|nr:hypothetical protein [Janthinobacterium sp. LM6]AQR69445.1 hypothetical protein BZG29_14685 [Janthinobacterium sp. LM6]